MNHCEALHLGDGAIAAELPGTSISSVACAAIPAPVAEHNPFQAFLTEWEGMERAGACIPDEDHDAWSDRHLVPLDQRVADGNVPNATTAEGAAAALRKALDFGM